MNLLFRLVWMWLSARWRPKCEILEESHLTFRVFPTDLDVNLHLTNSRYFSFMDLSRVDHMIRNGAWQKIRANKLMPVLGSGSIRYRRPVPPFKKVDVTTRIAGCDDRWIYLEHKLVAGDVVYSIAVLKAAFIGKDGRISTPDLLNTLEYSGPMPPMTVPLKVIRDADDALMTISGA